MGFKEKISSLLGSKVINNSANEQFDVLLDKLMKEVYEGGYVSGYFGSIPFGKLEKYKVLKSSDMETRKAILFYIIPRINDYNKKMRALGFTAETRIKKGYQFYSELFNALMRSNLNCTEQEIMLFLEAYRKSDDNAARRFHDWPVGFTVQQIERTVKIKGLSEAFKNDLKGVLKWEQLQNDTYQWGSDLHKVYLKIEKIIFESENTEENVVPYILPQDRLAEFVNSEIEKLKAKEQNPWYSLFHLFMKATGSKPSVKYLKNTNELIDNIGSSKYRKAVEEWLNFVISLKVIVTPQVYDYGGETTEYFSYDFLHEKNKIFLKGLVWSLMKFHDSKTLGLVEKLTERSFKKIPGFGLTAAGVGNACIYTLGNTKGLKGISYLSRLKLQIKHNNTKKLIEKYIETSSEKLGISSSEIEELSILDFGLEKGAKKYKLDDYTLELKIEGLSKVKLTWTKPDGGIQKTTPKFIKNSKKHEQTLKLVKEDVVQIKKYLTLQRDRIDRLYLYNRVWSYENFSKFYLNHGLVSFVAKDLVWEFKDKDKFIAAHWRQEKWKDINDKELSWITAETLVRLWHPINSEIDEVLSWRNKLEDLQIKQVLKQVHREVYILTDAEVNTKTYSNRMAAHLLKQHQFNALTAIRGWRYSLLGTFDNGCSGEIAKITLKEHGLEAQFWINEVNADDSFNDAGIWNYVATDQVRFIDENNEVKDLVDIPKMLFSEIMRDVDLFVGVASVGNDPEWRDNGGLVQYRDYWTSYSFGDLNEVAKTRKAILEKLIPRLKINKVAEIDGKFLKIRGTKRVYKIHIGSTNILMEPNNQYLCIIPKLVENKDAENLYLPFEGDRALSLILSKAFLLAADDKIDDTIILRQIHS